MPSISRKGTRKGGRGVLCSARTQNKEESCRGTASAVGGGRIYQKVETGAHWWNGLASSPPLGMFRRFRQKVCHHLVGTDSGSIPALRI